jgi:hypothetical protein
MRKALIIGIDDYSDAPLSGCVRDATQMASVLERNGDGSPNFDIQLITSPAATVERASLRAGVEELFQGDNDVSLLYFSGHGYIDATGGYLVTTDHSKYEEGMSMDVILNMANASKVKNKIIILDCCYSGAAGSPAILGEKHALLAEGMSVLTASRSDESALEVDGSGVFTSLVIDALGGGAADLRGNVTPGSLYAYVDEALGAWDQRPIFKTNVTSFVKLRVVPPKVPLETLRKITEYFPEPSSEHQLDPTYEFEEPGHDPANVAIFKDLQKLEGAALVVPVGEEHMYHAAINSRSCRLTALGFQYWRLAHEGKI